MGLLATGSAAILFQATILINAFWDTISGWSFPVEVSGGMRRKATLGSLSPPFHVDYFWSTNSNSLALKKPISRPKNEPPFSAW